VCGNSSSPQSAGATSGTAPADRTDWPVLDRPTNGSAPRRAVRPVPGRCLPSDAVRWPDPRSRRAHRRPSMDSRSIRDFILTGGGDRLASCSGRSRWVHRVPFPLSGETVSTGNASPSPRGTRPDGEGLHLARDRMALWLALSDPGRSLAGTAVRPAASGSRSPQRDRTPVDLSFFLLVGFHPHRVPDAPRL
jgi:hypothetical protein